MAKSGRGRAPRDRKRPYRFPKPPCSPTPPKSPKRVRPEVPGCDTGPDISKLKDLIRPKRRR
jgi:hypothetical protein